MLLTTSCALASAKHVKCTRQAPRCVIAGPRSKWAQSQASQSGGSRSLAGPLHASAGDPGNSAPRSFSLNPVNWVKGALKTTAEQLGKYIPAQVMGLWAIVKQGLDVLFEGAINTPNEAYTFAIVWTVFMVGVGLWTFWSLKNNKLTIRNDDDITTLDMVIHAAVTAFAFALYTSSFGSHSDLVKEAMGVPEKVLKSVEGALMVAFPFITRLLGDTHVAQVVE